MIQHDDSPVVTRSVTQAHPSRLCPGGTAVQRDPEHRVRLRVDYKEIQPLLDSGLRK